MSDSFQVTYKYLWDDLYINKGGINKLPQRYTSRWLWFNTQLIKALNDWPVFNRLLAECSQCPFILSVNNLHSYHRKLRYNTYKPLVLNWSDTMWNKTKWFSSTCSREAVKDCMVLYYFEHTKQFLIFQVLMSSSNLPQNTINVIGWNWILWYPI